MITTNTMTITIKITINMDNSIKVNSRIMRNQTTKPHFIKAMNKIITLIMPHTILRKKKWALEDNKKKSKHLVRNNLLRILLTKIEMKTRHLRIEMIQWQLSHFLTSLKTKTQALISQKWHRLLMETKIKILQALQKEGKHKLIKLNAIMEQWDLKLCHRNR